MSHWEAPPQSVEWYTPAWVFGKLTAQFDLDVAPARLSRGNVPAIKLKGDGLLEPWHGFVWMNPPYAGRGTLQPWVERFAAHGNGIALLPDRTSAPWFQWLFPRADAVIFTRKIKFERPDGSVGRSPSNGSALIAIGERGRAYLERGALNGLGILAEPAGQLGRRLRA